MTALDTTSRHRNHNRCHRIALSALAELIAGETAHLKSPYAAFAIHPDRTAVLVDDQSTITVLRPEPDGLYDVDQLKGLNPSQATTTEP